MKIDFLDKGFDKAWKLVKNGVILRSGVYKYHKSELPKTLPAMPEEYKDREWFFVYRPPEVVEKANAEGIFTRLPIVVEHPDVDVTPENFSKLAVGITGDSTQTENIDGELALTTTLSILDKKGFQAYNSGIRELSPKYDGETIWQAGKTDKGEEYQLMITGFFEPNHLAIVSRGRGGHKIRIQDSMEEKNMDVKDLFKVFSRVLGQKPRYLDSMEEGNYSDEDKEYMFRELHKMLESAGKGELSDYRPEGFSGKESGKEKPKDAEKEKASKEGEEESKPGREVEDSEEKAEKKEKGKKEDKKEEEKEEEKEDEEEKEEEKEDKDKEDKDKDKEKDKEDKKEKKDFKDSFSPFTATLGSQGSSFKGGLEAFDALIRNR